jgi:prepilin-type N-terminal cleavage/methylation domain-containing protein
MKPRGFTLLEVLLVTIMLGILGMVLGPILGKSVGTFNIISSRQQVLAEARSGMDRMVRELRLTPSATLLSNIGVTNLQFQYPLDTNITYSLSNGNLLRNSDVLVGNLTSLIFTYYDQAGSVAVLPINVRSIGIQMTVNSSSSNSTLTLRTRVFLRNTGNGYANFTSP